jgi:hypothetical protein
MEDVARVQKMFTSMKVDFGAVTREERRASYVEVSRVCEPVCRGARWKASAGTRAWRWPQEVLFHAVRNRQRGEEVPAAFRGALETARPSVGAARSTSSWHGRVWTGPLEIGLELGRPGGRWWGEDGG